MIFTVTDFGVNGPYLGQMQAALMRFAPAVPVIHLMSDLPAMDPRTSAYLLAALVQAQQCPAVFVCVVDPGVGTRARRPVWLQADGHRLVGPDNGLFDVVAARAKRPRWYEILWRPELLSASFHGRDLFAPVAARLALDQCVDAQALRRRVRHSARLPEELDAIIYIDGFGNCITGRRASSVAPNAVVHVNGVALRFARTFGGVERGQAFWYENSLGLVEVAIREASATERLRLRVGTSIEVG